MPPVGFEPTISAGERPKTYALEGAATGTGSILLLLSLKLNHYQQLRTLNTLSLPLMRPTMSPTHKKQQADFQFLIF